MISVKPKIYAHHRRSDGSYPVKIKITFNRQARHLPTTLTARADQLTRSLKIKDGFLIAQTNALCDRIRGALADLTLFELDGKNVDWVVEHVKGALREESFKLDFFEFADSYLQSKTQSTRVTYITALNTLERFVGARQLNVNDITRAMLLEFMEFVEKEPKMKWQDGKIIKTTAAKIPKAAASRHIAKLGHIFEAAKLHYNDDDRTLIPRSPFAGIHKDNVPSEGQRNLGVEVMQRIIDDGREDDALAAFVVSFALFGANLADLYAAPHFDGTVWKYNRQKTRNRRADRAAMQVTVPDCLQLYIKRLRARGPRTYWLPVLHTIGGGKDACTALINRRLRKWCEREGVEPFTFGAARHSWASIARAAGVEKATVDECLCHVGDFEITDIYAERAWDLQTAANEKVLALFRW